jgi:hypothetical protein
MKTQSALERLNGWDASVYDLLKSMRGEPRGGIERISMTGVFNYLKIPVNPRARNNTQARYIASLLHSLGWKPETRRRLLTAYFYRPMELSVPDAPTPTGMWAARWHNQSQWD